LHAVDFSRDVHPLLVARCLPCHTGDKGQGGLNLATRDGMAKGGVSGPALVAGDPAASLLLRRVDGTQNPRMPMAGKPLSEAEIELLRAWVREGAKIDATRMAPSQFSLALRPPTASGPDELLPPTASPLSDAAFLRRAYLDLWGLLPSPEALDAFLADNRSGKRAAVIDRLLADRRRYAEHWISFWNDLLHNDEGTIYHGTRQSITPWLLNALESNLPYDRFVRALLDPSAEGDPKGFLIGVNWRGEVNASQMPVMQAAQNSAQVFLGVNLKCNSCHDSFVSHWKLRDAYGVAAFFTDQPLTLVRCDLDTKEPAVAKFLYPELGGVDSAAPLAERRAAAARLFTAKENGQFARTIVNRYWKQLLGRGIVEPVDEMEAAPSNPKLLDWLAADFVAHGYDLQHLLKRIMLSRAYQQPLARPRRLTAEQFQDALSQLTGAWRVRVPAKPGAGEPAREWRHKANSLTRVLGRPVRDLAVTERLNDPSTLQALELANGVTLNDLLHDGAARLLGLEKPAPVPLWDSGLLRNAAKATIDIAAPARLYLIAIDVDSYDPARVHLKWTTEGPSELGQELVVEPKAPRFQATVSADPALVNSEINPAYRVLAFAEKPERKRLIPVSGALPEPAPRVPRSSRELAITLFQAALSRPPSAGELAAALQLLGPQPSVEGTADLLWSLILSPEFQYVR
jgi:hypothetical protein